MNKPVNDEAAAVPVEETGNTPQQPGTEVDFERILSGDEAYTADISAKLSGETPDAPAAETIEGKEVVEGAKPAPTDADLDPDEVVGEIVFRGKTEQVKRKDAQRLWQEGRYNGVRTEELSPLIRLSKEAPDVLELARTPEGRAKIVERIRQTVVGGEAKPEAVESVDGYDPSDVAAVAKISRAQVAQALREMGIEPKASGPTAEQVALVKADQAEMAAEARHTLSALRTVDPAFEPKMALLQEVVAEVERTESPEKFRAFFAAINDPRVRNPQTGRPAFLHFWDDISAEYARRTNPTQPAAPEVPTVPNRRPAPSGGRMAPGGASPPAHGTPPIKDWSKVPDKDLDALFDEALARG